MIIFINTDFIITCINFSDQLFCFYALYDHVIFVMSNFGVYIAYAKHRFPNFINVLGKMNIICILNLFNNNLAVDCILIMMRQNQILINTGWGNKGLILF